MNDPKSKLCTTLCRASFVWLSEGNVYLHHIPAIVTLEIELDALDVTHSWCSNFKHIQSVNKLHTDGYMWSMEVAEVIEVPQISSTRVIGPSIVTTLSLMVWMEQMKQSPQTHQ